MAVSLGGLRAISHPHLLPLPSFSSSENRRRVGFRCYGRPISVWRAMVQQQSFEGASSNYAKEMERLSAKEALLLAFKDAGGFEALVGGKITDKQRVDVHERVIGLERLNPTPCPTTSPLREGKWKFEWFGIGSPGLHAATFLFQRSPSTLAKFSGLTVQFNGGYSKLTATFKFLNSIERKFLLTAKWYVEGPIRMKEVYNEALFVTPISNEEARPEQLKGVLGQTAGRLQQLPARMRDAFGNGLKFSFSGTSQRLFLISYLDEEIIIVRDATGAPDVLTKLEGPPEPMAAEPVI